MHAAWLIGEWGHEIIHFGNTLKKKGLPFLMLWSLRTCDCSDKQLYRQIFKGKRKRFISSHRKLRPSRKDRTKNLVLHGYLLYMMTNNLDWYCIHLQYSICEVVNSDVYMNVWKQVRVTTKPGEQKNLLDHGCMGFEPVTFGLLFQYSNQLSYRGFVTSQKRLEVS